MRSRDKRQGVDGLEREERVLVLRHRPDDLLDAGAERLCCEGSGRGRDLVACGIEEDRVWLSYEAEVGPDVSGRIEHARVGDVELVRKTRCILRLVEDVHTQELHLIPVLASGGRKQRCFGSTRSAPRSPDVHDNRGPLQLRKQGVELALIERGESGGACRQQGDARRVDGRAPRL